MAPEEPPLGARLSIILLNEPRGYHREGAALFREASRWPNRDP
jgi:hypothetical protein